MEISRKFFKQFLVVSAAAATFSLSGCGSSDQDSPIDNTTPPSPLAKYEGVWQQAGSGIIWQFTDAEFIQYSHNSFGCVMRGKQRFDTVSGLENYLVIDDQKLRLNNNATTDWTFDKRALLPAFCLSDNLKNTDDAGENFEFLWRHFYDYYAHFIHRGIDWLTIYDEYRPRITNTTSQAELASIFDEMLSNIDDVHVTLTDEQTVDIAGGELAGLARETVKYLVKSGVDDLQAQLSPTYREIVSVREALISQYFSGNELLSHPHSDAMLWGVMDNNIGYLRITRESNFMARSQTASGVVADLVQADNDLSAAESLMDEAMLALSASDALIVDLRLNEGGFDKVSQKIASYFNTQSKTFATKQTDNRLFTSEQTPLRLDAAENPYTKPVYVITGQSNVSAGEVLALALSSLPQVTIVGQPTHGSLSDALDFTLPNGWQGTLSHQIYRNANGDIVEQQGVIPALKVPVYSIEDFNYVSDNAIDAILVELEKSVPQALNLEALDTQLSQAKANLGIPALAVALVHDGEIVFERGYGDIELGSDISASEASTTALSTTALSTTEKTPFNIGSISKAVMATAIAQKIEQQALTLDTQLNEMNLPFSVNNVTSDTASAAAITLKHLVTHTSGIFDSAAYVCSYYIHNTDLSLYAAFIEGVCPQQTTTDSTVFFNRYFTEQDELNPVPPFLDAAPGQLYQYSNVAAGLAGYAIERYLAIDFAADMKANIFDVLGMSNTHWDYRQLNPEHPKAAHYTLTEDGEIVAIPEYSYPTRFDGDLNSSAHDLARLMLALSQGGALNGQRILTPESVNMMFSPQVETADFMAEDLGIFWFRSGGFVGHTGGDPGTNATFQYNPATKTGFVLLMNIEDSVVGKNQLGESLEPVVAAIYRAGLLAASD